MKIFEGDLQAKGLKFGIVISRFNEFITGKLLDGAKDALIRHGAKEEDIDIVKVPGSFEIPLIAKKMAAKGTYNAIICLGTVIRGATPHFDYISAEVSKGIATVSIDSMYTPVRHVMAFTDDPRPPDSLITVPSMSGCVEQ